jgi:hypothetical protein
MNMQAAVFRKVHKPLTIAGVCSSRRKSYSDFLRNREASVQLCPPSQV